jgi:ABC-2 type transport system ATP-binding protein
MKLRLDRIRKEYGDKVAVNDLTLEVPEGDIYGVIGPNGAGKTTTIRMIMNITAPDSGRVLIDGRPPDGSFLNRVGYLPEERGLYKKMTVSEVLTYLAELKGYPASKARADMVPWLERVNLAEYQNSKVEELSKGMAQKLQFVSTILHQPDLLILDEIFSGLDPLNMELLKDIMMEQKRAGRTILFSTHVMEQAEKLCDHVCMIASGNKVIDGRLGDVKAQFGRNCIHLEIEGDGGFIRALPGVKDVLEFNNYQELALEDGADSQAILRELVGRVKVLRFDVIEPSLYDIFIDMARIDPSQLVADPAGGSHV